MIEQTCLFDAERDKARHVEQITRDIARPFVEAIHYSRLLPNNVVYCFGLYEDASLIGVVTYGIPASPPLCKGLAGGAMPTKY